MQELLGKKLNNRYEVMRPLGEGGMGKVYVARDRRFGKEVVVKVPTMESGDGEYKDRFMREIASLAKLEHAHIVPTLDWGEVEGVPFLVLRYLGGGSLRNRITDEKGYYRPMSLEGLTHWLPQIASALDFIHGKGWVHRDLKPDNILFDESGSPYLADFGIAKALEGNVMGVKTTTGAFIGTPQYMAPEMHLGKGIGPKADQFGLAVLVYESLAGKIPFEGATPTAIFVEVMQGKARPIHEIVSGIGEEKSGVLAKAISKDPRARYATCAEFAAAMLGESKAGGTQPANTPVKTPPSVQIPSTRLATPVRPEIPATMQVKAQQPSGIEPTKLVTPKRQDIPATRMETPEKKTRVKNDIPATRFQNEIKQSETTPFSDFVFDKVNSKNTQDDGSETESDLLEENQGNLNYSLIIVGVIVFVGLVVLYGFYEFQSSRQMKKKEAELIADLEEELVLIPAGRFKMGSPKTEKGRSESETQHEVTLTQPYYMGKYEVTQKQWAAVMGNNPMWSTEAAKLPATHVSWNDCQEFIKKLNAKTKGGYRLPTEAEWEYACRAGTTTTYSVGDSLTKADANIENVEIRPVGCYKPNAFGLYDMHGNVCEWCEDWYGVYPPGSVTDPKGPVTGVFRVLRGGDIYKSDDRSSYRDKNTPTSRESNYGFRLARTKP